MLAGRELGWVGVLELPGFCVLRHLGLLGVASIDAGMVASESEKSLGRV
jgi:hypothetical protein